MRIAYIFDQLMPSIVTESMQPVNVLSGFANIGCECTLFVPGANDKSLPTAEEFMQYYNVSGRFRVECVHSIYPGPRMAQKVVHPLICSTLLRKKLASFDVVYTRNIPAAFACIFAGIPVVLDGYRPWPEQYHHALVPVFKLLFASRHFIGMTTHSEYARQSFIKAGFPQDRICTAHNGFVKQHYEPVLSKQQAREKLGLLVDGKIATYCGRFDMKKGIGHLLKLANARPDVTFIFVGAGYEVGVKSEFEIEAEKLPNCILTGWKKYNELPAYLYASDVLTIPPTLGPLKKAGHTVLPIKLYSYIAARRAIYAPIAPDTEELLTHNRNAWLVKPDDFQAELEGFNELIDNDDLLNRLSCATSEDAEHLSWDDRAQVVRDFMYSRLNIYKDR